MDRHIQNLLALVQEYAPTGPAYQTVLNDFKKAQKDGASEQEQIAILIGLVYDGLTYGNWPWSALYHRGP